MVSAPQKFMHSGDCVYIDPVDGPILIDTMNRYLYNLVNGAEDEGFELIITPNIFLSAKEIPSKDKIIGNIFTLNRAGISYSAEETRDQWRITGEPIFFVPKRRRDDIYFVGRIYYREEDIAQENYTLVNGGEQNFSKHHFEFYKEMESSRDSFFYRVEKFNHMLASVIEHKGKDKLIITNAPWRIICRQ